MPDKYINRAFLQVVESAANTLTFSQLTTGISTFSKQAFVIHQIEWFMSMRNLMVASSDYIQAAITASNKMVGISLDDPAIIALKEWHCVLSGAAANLNLYQTPDVIDYSSLPGGGLIIPANPIFIAVEGVSLASPITLSARIGFTVIDLKADEYIELVEAIRMIE